jgi:hypothetical protein
MTKEDSYRLIVEVTNAFTPSTPITSRDSFAGRSREIQKVIGVVTEPGKHAIIYGERGVGKTSLANTCNGSRSFPLRFSVCFPARGSR